jgi:hypothetical protein
MACEALISRVYIKHMVIDPCILISSSQKLILLTAHCGMEAPPSLPIVLAEFSAYPERTIVDVAQ